MITKSVIQLLLANTALASIVGTRIRPNVIKPDDTFPAMWVSSYEMQNMPCDNSNGVYSGTIEIGVQALEYGKCVQVMDLVRSSLNDFSGTVGNVGISFMTGQETADDYDETGTRSIKVIEYQAYAQIK